MALRHIVTWKLSGETVSERDAQAAEIVAALSPLADIVPSVRSLSVHRNEINHGENWDVTLVSTFDDAEGLTAYAVHPDHVAAAAIVKSHAVQRACVDFEV